MGMRGGEWKRMLLEEHYHEAPDVSYADVTAKDFEVVPDDFVIKSCLQQDDLAYPFDIKEFTVSLLSLDSTNEIKHRRASRVCQAVQVTCTVVTCSDFMIQLLLNLFIIL